MKAEGDQSRSRGTWARVEAPLVCCAQPTSMSEHGIIATNQTDADPHALASPQSFIMPDELKIIIPHSLPESPIAPYHILLLRRAVDSNSLVTMAKLDNHHIPGAAPPAMEMVTFTTIIDDIVFPDGRTSMSCLGGGGPQSAFGARLWFSNGERVGLAAGVGADFPDSCKDWLEAVGIDTSGLVLWPSSTLRTWQHSEPLDGCVREPVENENEQTEIFRETEGDQSWEMLLPELKVLPPLYQKAKTYHVAVHPSGLDVGFLRTLRDSGAEILSVEVYTHAEEAVPHSDLQALVSTGHIFSPNEREAASLVGTGTPLELIGRLSKLGAQIVVLRQGHLGSTVHRSDTKETWHVPAFHTVFYAGSEANGNMKSMTKSLEKSSLDSSLMHVKTIVDPTGCGNTFCGGFLAGWYKTRNLLTAALWGSISASFMLEYEGVPPPLVSEWRAAAQLRLTLLQPHAKRVIFT